MTSSQDCNTSMRAITLMPSFRVGWPGKLSSVVNMSRERLHLVSDVEV